MSKSPYAVPLTAEETKLTLALAAWLKQEMTGRLEEWPEPGLLHDMAQSNFEAGCSALQVVGVFEREGRYWRVLPETPLKLPSGFARDGLDQMLDAMASHSFYVTDLHKHAETTIPGQPGLRDVCEAMMACGYMATPESGSYSWTQKFGPWMVRHGARDLLDFDPAPQIEVDRVLSALPDDALDWLSSSNGSYQPSFVRRFFASWFSSRWNSQTWWEYPSDDWDLPLAAGLYIQLH